MAVGALFVLYAQIATTQATTDDLKTQVARLTDQGDRERTEVVKLCASLVEIETQMRASDGERNLTHAADLRTQAMLWRKAFGADMPIANAFYPTIGVDRPAACG